MFFTAGRTFQVLVQEEVDDILPKQKIDQRPSLTPSIIRGYRRPLAKAQLDGEGRQSNSTRE